jgi:hypothetical protein
VARFCRAIFPTPDELASEFSKYLGDFSWVNVYRPLDPIGSSIFSNQSSSTEDASTRQWKKLWMAAHTGYWDDECVLSTVTKSLALLRSHSKSSWREAAPQRDSGTDSDWLSASRAIAFYMRQSRWLSTAMATVLALAIAFLCFNVASTYFRDQDNDAFHARLEGHGIATTGWLYHFSRIEGFGDGKGNTTLVTIDYYLVIFRAKQGYVGYSLDEKRWFLAGVEQQLSSWESAMIFSDELFWQEKVPAMRRKMTVRYLEGDPEQFDIAELESPPSFPMLGIIARIVGTVFALVISGLIAGYVWGVSKRQVAAYCGVYTPDPFGPKD